MDKKHPWRCELNPESCVQHSGFTSGVEGDANCNWILHVVQDDEKKTGWLGLKKKPASTDADLSNNY